MRVNWTCGAIAVLTILIPASHAAAQVPFQWRGRLAPGQTIEIKGINGGIRATASSSPEVEVTAIRTARRSNPEDVRIEVVPHGGGVTICAVYPTPPDRDPNRCEPGGGGAVEQPRQRYRGAVRRPRSERRRLRRADGERPGRCASRCRATPKVTP